MLDVAGDVCGPTKGKPRHIKTWWWNDDVTVVINRKRELLKIWKRSSNEGNRRQCCEAKKVVKRVVAAAMDQTSRKAIWKVEINFNGRELFQIAKQRGKERYYALGVNCLKDKNGEVKVAVDEHKNHMEKLMNVGSE